MTPNDKIQMKVLQNLRDHMDRRMGERLRPKKTPAAPGAPGVGADKAASLAAIAPPAADPAQAAAPGQAPSPGMGDDDVRRLKELYSRIK